MLKLFIGLVVTWQARAHDDFGELRVVCMGCSSGIGRSAAELLLAGGAHVVLSARSPEKVKDILVKYPSTAHTVAADAADPAQVTRLAKEARKFFGQPASTLIWAPTSTRMGPFHILGAEGQIEALKDQLNINVYGLLRLVEALKDDLISVGKTTPGSASVLAISSIVSENPILGALAYSSGKAAQDSVMKSLAQEFASFGVRFNSVLPATIETPVFDMFPKEQRDAFIQDVIHRHALGRIGQPDEVGHLMAFLSSQKASFITGQMIKVDGGSSLLNSHIDSFSPTFGDANKDDRFFPIARKWSLQSQASVDAKKEL